MFSPQEDWKNDLNLSVSEGNCGLQSVEKCSEIPKIKKYSCNVFTRSVVGASLEKHWILTIEPA